MVKDIHKYKDSRHSKKTEKLFDKFAYLYIMESNQINDRHPLVNAASRQGPNPNILSHDSAMRVVERDMFEISMAEELDKM